MEILEMKMIISETNEQKCIEWIQSQNGDGRESVNLKRDTEQNGMECNGTKWDNRIE